MDGFEEVWVCGGFEVDGEFFVSEVRFSLLLPPSLSSLLLPLFLSPLFWKSTLTERVRIPTNRFDVPPDCSVELSPLGYHFFTELFETFDKDQDGALNASELDELFSTSPGNPWTAKYKFPDSTVADDSGAVTLQGWLAQWRYVSRPFSSHYISSPWRIHKSMTTLLEPKTTLSYLAYLGYPTSPSSPTSPSTSALEALHITRPRSQDRRKGKSTRNVFLCYVCGAAGSGKTSLLRAFAGKPFLDSSSSNSASASKHTSKDKGAYEPTKKMMSVVNSVDIEGEEKYLVLQEFGSQYEAEVLRESTGGGMGKGMGGGMGMGGGKGGGGGRRGEMVDVMVYVHDSADTNSFSYVSNLRVCFSFFSLPPSPFLSLFLSLLFASFSLAL